MNAQPEYETPWGGSLRLIQAKPEMLAVRSAAGRAHCPACEHKLVERVHGSWCPTCRGWLVEVQKPSGEILTFIRGERL
jgi:Zn finger protein HypA/HybF involved in hydrogenase expression